MEQFTFNTLEYIRPCFEVYESEVLGLTDMINNAYNYETVSKAIGKYEELTDQMNTMVTIAYIRHTLDTSDEFYEKEIEYVSVRGAEVGTVTLRYNNSLLTSNFRDEIIKEFGDEYLIITQREVEQFDETLVPYLQSESLLTLRYQKIMSKADIMFQGESHNLYGIRTYFHHKDRDIRKEAFSLFSNFYEQNEEELASIFDELVKVRDEMGKALGHVDYIPLGYGLQKRIDYGEKEIEVFRAEILEEIVPLCSRIYEAQAKRIGVDKIMIYDEEFILPDDEIIPIGNTEYLLKEAIDMYHDMSKETGDFIDYMVEHKLYDLENRKHKASAGYMTLLPSIKAPYVFSCFVNTTYDVEVLTHEMGHAFAGYQAMRNQKTSQYTTTGSDITEIHSMSMEQFAYPYAERFFGDKADNYRFTHLQNAITFLPFGAAVDEFQHIVYKNPKLTMKERNEVYRNLEKKYMPWRAYDNDEFMEQGGYWYNKTHIYLYPFYFINYALTTMGALEFKKKITQDKESGWKEYLELCNAGASKGYLELMKSANLSIPFEKEGVKNAISYAKEVLLNELNKRI